MGRLGDGIVRFPHTCEIYTVGNATPFSDGTTTVVWSGRCRKESNTSIRTFKGSDSVLKSDYRIQLGAIPGGSLDGDADYAYDGVEGKECGAVVEGIVAGMQIDVTDKQGTFVGLVISEAYATNLGTTLYCDNPKT